MKKLMLVVLVAILVTACNSKPSLQEYLVEKENSKDFISASIPTNMIFQNIDSLSSEETTSLRKIEKINLLALTKKKGETILEDERQELRTILNESNYESLMNYSGGDKEAKFVYAGTEDKIDQLIFFGFDSEIGLLLLRMRGNEVNVNDIFKISQSAQRFNMSALLGGFDGFIEELK